MKKIRQSIKKDFRWTRSGHIYKFFIDGEEVDFTLWNRIMNEKLSMDQFQNHPNILVKFEMKSRINRIIKLLDAKRDEVIVDIGTEKGEIASNIKEYGKIICVDIDHHMLKEAKKALDNTSIYFIVGEAQHLPLKSGLFDKVMSNHLLEHLPDPQKGVEELFRIVKRRGRIVINVPNEGWILFCKKILDKTSFIVKWGYPGHAPGHLHNFNKKVLFNLCRRVKGKIEKSRFTPFLTQIIVRVLPFHKTS